MDDGSAAVFGLRLVVVCVLFCIGYFGTRQIETRYGQGSAQLPPAVWGVLFAFCFLPSLIAAAIVSSRAKKRFNSAPAWPPAITYPPAARQQHPPMVSPPQPSPGSSGGGGGSSPGQTILPGQ
ncbi:MAG TPA: hypothetical protein VFX15_13475 [Actinomycetes bacterium]|nr:hypothetical protein [Actinomycetes bacterium]